MAMYLIVVETFHEKQKCQPHGLQPQSFVVAHARGKVRGESGDHQSHWDASSGKHEFFCTTKFCANPYSRSCDI